MIWRCRNLNFTFPRPALVMGIVNVTPDSFSDGGRFLDSGAAIAQGLRLLDEGADILDIGGESSRPGSLPISLEEELNRVLPVVAALARQTKAPLSVDTTKAEVARACLDAGAHIVNDITALTGDPAMVAVAAQYGAGVVLMHMQGTPATMQDAPEYDDVVAEVAEFLQIRIEQLAERGIAVENIALDPGIGFGKTVAHNVQLVQNLPELAKLERPICLGVSRKGFIGKLLGRPLEERLAGSLACAAHAIAQSGAHILRVHDVAATCDLVRMLGILCRRA